MFITVSRLPRMIFRSLLPVSLTFALVACGGGGEGGGGGGGGGNTTLFEENFNTSGSLPNNWSPTGLGASGTIEHDLTAGYFGDGSMKMGGNSKAQAVASSFSVANGLRIYVAAKIPYYTRTDGSVSNALVIEIESAKLGTGNAHVSIWRSPCGSTAPTRIEYYIQTSSFEVPNNSGDTLGFEEFSCGWEPGDFVVFKFIVYPDGTSEWQRDGIRKLSYGYHFGLGEVKLNLHGGGLNSDGVPSFYHWFDDIWVVK